MKGCVYLITCSANGKKYVGLHGKPDPQKRWRGHVNDAKGGSKLILHNAIRLYGEENFTIETLCVCSHDALPRLEEYYAEQLGTYIWDPEPGYNMVWCGDKPNLGMKRSSEMCEKLRQANLGKKKSPEACEKMRQASLGKKMSPEACEKMRQANIGKKMSPEAIEKTRQANIGRKMSPEACEKSRQANIGKKRSPETCEKMRQAWILRHEKLRQEKSLR